MKILAIGNSFSQDATALLQLLTDQLVVRNLYIGGCSLERHRDNAKSDAAVYDFQENGEKLRPTPISIREALTGERWDAVTVQQVSGKSGIVSSYEPYLSELLQYIRRYSDAEILLHETWSYETGSTHSDFAAYGRDSEKMADAIEDACATVAKAHGLRRIPVGRAIREARHTPSFDPSRGGLSIHRDGFHLSLNYGRLLAASVWCRFFTGEIPEIFGRENLSCPMADLARVLHI